ncbi:MAG: hypothetical protein H6560_04890 [Lewinellaceae bacterium]|nr:hypothetical protein [Lewinellaceae bacterium]
MARYGHILTDSLGLSVLYYSNGLHIYNRQNQVMENGDTINPGYFWQLSYPQPYIYSASGLSVPYPGRPDEYLYFHQRFDSLNVPPNCCWFPRDIYYSHIDMSANDGLGRVVSKNNTVYADYSSSFGLTKTGDNRGWWLVFGALRSNIFYTYVVDSLGVSLHRIDTLGGNIYEGTTLRDQPSLGGFSPDGTKFAKCDYWHGITLLDFDRCEGRLSNPRFYPVDSTNSSTSLAFSPNSRFIYYNTSSQLMQLDTWANPDEHPLDTIANWDAYYELNTPPFGDGFAFSQLAPDGKIYISASASSRHLHVIERPNLPGQACGFRQHGFPLPTSNGTTVPHFPNYRLEPIDCN